MDGYHHDKDGQIRTQTVQGMVINMETKELYMARKARKCRHFRSIMDSKTCCADVAYETLGSHKWPCHGHVGESVCVCNSYEPYTAQEISEKQEKDKKEIEYLSAAFRSINQLSGSGGMIDCPKCNGQLQWSRAGNGHVHGQCASVGCMAWMQ
jgi:hypothetical protein